MFFFSVAVGNDIKFTIESKFFWLIIVVITALGPVPT